MPPMTPEEIIAVLLQGEQLITDALGAWSTIKAEASANSQAAVNAQVASSGSALDAARALLDADAAS